MAQNGDGLGMRLIRAWIAYAWDPDPEYILKPTDPHIVCRHCWSPKPPEAFHRTPVGGEHGRKLICKSCHAATYGARSEAKKKAARVARRAANPVKAKCMRCGASKPIAQYGITSHGRRSRYCADCAEAIVRDRRERLERVFYEPDAHKRRSTLEWVLSDGTLTPEAVRELFAAAKDCPYCGVKMCSRDKTRDHMVPISKGGANSLANILICCKPCNSKKRDMDFDSWLQLLATESRQRLEKLYRKRFGVVPEQRGLVLVYDPSARVM
jgi:hypothetical protein